MPEFEGVNLDVVDDEYEMRVLHVEWECDEWNVALALAVGERSGVLGFVVSPLDVGRPLGAPLSSLLSAELAEALAAEAWRWEPSQQLTAPRVPWAPRMEWGVSYDVLPDLTTTAVESFGWAPAAERAARKHAETSGHPLMRRPVPRWAEVS